MKGTIKIVLAALVGLLIYLVYDSVSGPMKELKEIEKREKAVIARLEKVRDAELAYKDVKGVFTKDWDELIEFIKVGKFKVLIKEGDEDDSTSVVRYDSIFVSIKDSLFKNFNVDSLAFVPYGIEGGLKFQLDAGTITQNEVTVQVFEAKDPKPFSKTRQQEKNALKVGSMTDATYSGNWQ
jgi:hypothetical protein